MQARIVFIHGIGGPREPAAELTVWLEALAEGCRAAGHSRFAGELLAGTAVDARFAYYGDLFSPAQAQGTGLPELSAEAAEILASLLEDTIAEHCDMGDVDADTLRLLIRARSQVAPAGQPQGAQDIVRRVLNAATTLLGIGPLQKAGQWTVNKILVGHLAQVARYLARGELDSDGRPLDERIRERVAVELGSEKTIVVAHSLGSVVAWEELHEARASVPLFVTIGSPIATRTVVWPRLRPQPPSTPECVGSWLNFWDRDDLVVARPRLEKDIVANSSGVWPRSARVDSDGLWVHSAVKYLRRADVAGPIVEAVHDQSGT